MNYEYFFYFKIKQSKEIYIQVLIHFIHYFFLRNSHVDLQQNILKKWAAYPYFIHGFNLHL